MVVPARLEVRPLPRADRRSGARVRLLEAGASKESQLDRRISFLHALARGLPIVTMAWVEDSARSGSWAGAEGPLLALPSRPPLPALLRGWAVALSPAFRPPADPGVVLFGLGLEELLGALGALVLGPGQLAGLQAPEVSAAALLCRGDESERDLDAIRCPLPLAFVRDRWVVDSVLLGGLQDHRAYLI